MIEAIIDADRSIEAALTANVRHRTDEAVFHSHTRIGNWTFTEG